MDKVELCHYCNVNPGTTRDHIIPRALGGGGERWNLVPACASCNHTKSDRIYEEFTGRPLPARAQMRYPSTQAFLEGDLRTTRIPKMRVNRQRKSVRLSHPALVIMDESIYVFT